MTPMAMQHPSRASLSLSAVSRPTHIKRPYQSPPSHMTSPAPMIAAIPAATTEPTAAALHCPLAPFGVTALAVAVELLVRLGRVVLAVSWPLAIVVVSVFVL